MPEWRRHRSRYVVLYIIIILYCAFHRGANLRVRTTRNHLPYKAIRPGATRCLTALISQRNHARFKAHDSVRFRGALQLPDSNIIYIYIRLRAHFTWS